MLIRSIAVIEDGSHDTAFGVVFPDLPGCFSAGDSYEEAVSNAAEALSLQCEGLNEDGKPRPVPRALEVVAADPGIKADFAGSTYSFATIVAPVPDPGTYSQRSYGDDRARPGLEESSD